MNPVFAAALELQRWCLGRGWQFCIIGGVAVQRWGEPRFTRDVDCTILVAAGEETAYIDELLAAFEARIPDARPFAQTNRVLLLASSKGVPLDVSLGGLPFEERLLMRASAYRVSADTELITCSAEDLVILKAFAARDRDWADIEGIVLRQGPRLDRALVRTELRPLLELKEDSMDVAGRLEQMFRRRHER